jgi:hypothetical protein
VYLPQDASLNLLSNKLGVTLAAMVNNSNSFHEQFPLLLLSKFKLAS